MRAEVRFDSRAGRLRTRRGGRAKQKVIAIDNGKRRSAMSPSLLYSEESGCVENRGHSVSAVCGNSGFSTHL